MTQAKKKPAARKTAVQTDKGPKTPNEVREEQGLQPVEETDEDRAAAGEARAKKARTPGKNQLDDYEQKHEPLEHADFDHHSAEEKRQAELTKQRDEHNRRVGDASLA